MDAPAQLLPARAARTRRRIRPLRTLLFIVGILVVVLVLVLIITRGNYSQPLAFITYPNATLTGTYSPQPGMDHTIYYSTDDWTRVTGYYVQQISFTDSATCKGVGDKEVAHCLIDRVTLGYEQTERITISTIDKPTNANRVEIDIDRTWSAN